MKKFIILLILQFPFLLPAQDVTVDSTAIYLLDHMSEVIGELKACSFTVKTSHDTTDYRFGRVTNYATSMVYMVGPDKMLVNTLGSKGHKEYWYNGEYLAYYSYRENNYALVPAPNNILSMIDSIHSNYGIDFPAADFFYPTFTDDLIEHFPNIHFLGRTKIDGKSTFHILASNEKMNVQIWIGDDSYNLPYKYLLTYLGEDSQPQFESTFSYWELNPDLPESMFSFIPPPGASEITILSKSE